MNFLNDGLLLLCGSQIQFRRLRGFRRRFPRLSIQVCRWLRLRVIVKEIIITMRVQFLSPLLQVHDHCCLFIFFFIIFFFYVILEFSGNGLISTTVSAASPPPQKEPNSSPPGTPCYIYHLTFIVWEEKEKSLLVSSCFWLPFLWWFVVPAISSPSRAPERSPTQPSKFLFIYFFFVKENMQFVLFIFGSFELDLFSLPVLWWYAVPGISLPSRAPQSSPTPPGSFYLFHIGKHVVCFISLYLLLIFFYFNCLLLQLCQNLHVSSTIF